MAQAINDAIAALEEKTTQVSGLVAVVDDYKTITLTWDAANNAESYNVYRKVYSSNEFKLISFGPIPLLAEIMPCNT